MTATDEKIVFGLSPPAGPGGKATMIVGIPRGAWEHMKNGKTHQVDLGQIGLALQFVLYGAEDHGEAMKVIEDFIRGEDQTYDDRRREDFSIAGAREDCLIRALRKWKCPACGGAKSRKTFGATGIIQAAPCDVCSESGLHPVARDAILAYSQPPETKVGSDR